MCTPTKDNAEFKGWKDAFGNTITAQSDVTGDLTVYAEWEDTGVVLTVRANDSNATVSQTSFTLDPGGDATFTVQMLRTSLYGIGNLSDLSVTCSNNSHGSISITGQSVPSSGKGYIASMPTLNSSDMWTKVTVQIPNVRKSMTCTFNLVRCTYFHIARGKYYIYKGFKVNGNHKDTADSKVYYAGTCVCAVRGWWKNTGESEYGYLLINQSKQLYYKWLAFETNSDHNNDYWDNACSSSTALW